MANTVQKLTHIPLLEKLSERVIRILGCNARPMTLQGTNTYLIGTGPKKILIDTGDPGVPDYVKNLQKALKEFQCSIQEIIITHWHIDHIGGVPNVCQDVIQSSNVKVSKFRRPADIAEYDIGFPYNFVKDNTIFQTQGATLRALYMPGHTDDHMVLLLDEENAMFSGDAILGETTAVFEDLHTYMGTLHKMLDHHPSVIYPAHGPVIPDPIQKISHYIEHRMRREQQIEDTLGQDPATPLTSQELVEHIYVGLADGLKRAANVNVHQHLLKLVKDGKVDCIEDGDVKRWQKRSLSNM